MSACLREAVHLVALQLLPRRSSQRAGESLLPCRRCKLGCIPHAAEAGEPWSILTGAGGYAVDLSDKTGVLQVDRHEGTGWKLIWPEGAG